MANEKSVPDDVQRSLRARLQKNVTKLFSSSTLAALIGFASFALAVRGLGAEQFGALVLVFTYVGAAIRFCGFQSWQALISFTAQHAENNNQDQVAATFGFGFFIDAIGCLLAAVLAWLLSPLFATLFSWSAEVERAVEVYTLVALVSLSGAPTAALRFYDRFDLIAGHEVASSMLKFFFVLVAFIWFPTFSGYLAAWMLGHVATHLLLVGLGRYTLRKAGATLRQREGARIKNAASWPLLRFLFISNLDGTLRVVREFDVQFVALFVDEAAAALVRVARQIGAYVGRLVDAYFVAIYPDLAKLAASKQWQALSRLVTTSSLQAGMLALVPLFGFWLLGQDLLILVFGNDFGNAFATTCVVILAMVIWGFVQPFSPAILALHKAETLLAIHAIAALAYLTGLIVLVPEIGAVGAGWALTLLYVTWGALAAFFYARHLRQSA